MSWQIISVLTFYLMFLALVILLFLIWRNSVRTQQAQQVLNQVAIKNAEAAHIAAEAARTLAKQLEKAL